MNHTPGPWVVEKSDSSSTGSVHYAVKTDYKPAEHDWSPRFITFMCGGLGDFHPSRKMNDYRSDPRIEADAQLIAAAPEMYEALKIALKALEDMPPQYGENRYEPMMLAAGAIAKAEGRQ